MTASNYVRSPELLSAASSRLLIVDMQEKLLRLMDGHEQLTANCVTLVQGARILDVPVDATEQYRKGLGPTTPALAELFGELPDKIRFSCAEVLDWAAGGTGSAGGSGEDVPSRHQVVVAGIEAHVCVLQTAFDLLAAGFEVYVVADAVLSRHLIDYRTALRRLSDAGTRIVTTEMVLFEWCEVSGTEQFKQISQLVKNRVRVKA